MNSTLELHLRYENAKLKAELKAKNYENQMLKRLVKASLVNGQSTYKRDSPITFTRADFLEEETEAETEEEIDRDNFTFEEDELIRAFDRVLETNYWKMPKKQTNK